MKRIFLICCLAFSAMNGYGQTYCSPSYPNGCSVANNRITHVQIGTINHAPPDCIVHDYTNITTQIIAGVSTPLTVISEGYCGVGAAVDLNHDGDFDDANEILALPGYLASQVQTYNMNITIPAGTPAGSYRLRVYNRLANSGNGTPQNSPCGVYGYGSWDDYTLYVGLNLGQDTSICEGDVLTLNANAGFSYLWNTGATTQTIDVTESGTYYVKIFNTTDTLSDTIQVTVNPAPVVILGNDITIVSGTSITLNAGNPGASYLWNTGAVSQLINVNTAGYYSVIVTDSNGCHGTDTIKITVGAVGINDVHKENNGFTVTPNPAKNVLYINTTDIKQLHTKARLTDTYGRVVRTVTIESKSQPLSLSGLSPGIYILKPENGSALKIVKEQ